MMNRLLPLFLLLLIGNYSIAQVENAVEDRSILSLPVFYYDAVSYPSSDTGKTRVDIFIQVPYNQIQFIKSKDKFLAEYLVTISIYDEHRLRLLSEKSWTEKIETADFDITISRNNSNLSLKSFSLQPNNYLIRIEVEDKDSRKNYSYSNVYKVEDFSDSLAMSGIMLISSKSNTDGNSKVIPNISGNIVQQKGMIPFFYEVYSDSKKNIVLNYLIVNKQQETIYSNTIDYTIDSGRNQIFYQIENLDVSIGEYLLRINLKDDQLQTLVTSSKSFYSRHIGIPESIKDLDKAIEQMIYIANTSDLKFIREASNYEAKLDRFLSFWKLRDPNPSTLENEIFNEYFRRVEYSNKTFSSYMEGWKSDMGMVYIILGAPNNVDRHPFDYDSKPYEIWEYYNINRQFVFVDRTGFGDYRLATPLYGDNYRFR
jgi:GWxTD domain-containing protein